MGTRNLICVVKGGEFKVAQYGQWDGYPEGEVAACLGFLRGADLAQFAAKLDGCRFGTEEEIEAVYAPYCDAGGWMTMAQTDAFKRSPFAYLSRDTGSDILSVVMNADRPLMLKDSRDFAADGLFCEWAYVIDLDRQTFEVYRGFHKTPVPDGERFAFLNDKREEGSEYYPVHHVKTYALNALPDDAQFVRDCDPAEEEAEA